MNTLEIIIRNGKGELIYGRTRQFSQGVDPTVEAIRALVDQLPECEAPAAQDRISKCAG